MSSNTVNGTGAGIINPTAFKTALELENVDNTSDANKPVSTATQTAIRARISFGSGPPLDANGTDGETYVDEDSGVLYKKASGTWSASFSPTNQEVIFATALPADATGANGDLAIIYTDGVISGLAEKSGGTWSQIASNSVTIPRPSDAGVIELVDHFLGGMDTTIAPGRVGELNWELLAPVGTGSAKGQSNGTTPRIGVLRIMTGATSGNVTTIQFSNGTDSGNTFIIEAITRLTDFVMRWEFQATTAGDYHIGLSNNPSTVAAPTRFVGVRALAGTTNFQFVATNGTPVIVDSGVAVDAAWHTFELAYDSATSEWLMSIDGGAQSRLAKTLIDSHTVTMAAWVKTNSATIQNLYIDTFQFYGKL